MFSDQGYEEGPESVEEEPTVVGRDVRGQALPVARDRHLLVRVEGFNVGQVVSLGSQPMVVGRSDECTLCLNEPGISRTHARITLHRGGYVLEDLQSANGTLVQGHPVTRHELRDGDLVHFGPIVAFRYSLTDGHHERLLRDLHAAAVIDALTGAYNRAHFDRRLASELSYARRHKARLGLVLVDLDHFQAINDMFGHAAGQHVLSEVSQQLSRTLRAEDIFARYGGQLFAILLRDVDLSGAAHVAERMRRTAQEMRIHYEGQLVPITVSAGVATLACCSPDATEDLVDVAERRRAAAKRSGRNCVVQAD